VHAITTMYNVLCCYDVMAASAVHPKSIC